MSQEDSVEGGKIEQEKSDENLEELLKKIEKNIIGSITRGIGIAENSGESSLSEIAEKSKADNRESIVIPNFSSAPISGTSLWQVSNPITLSSEAWLGSDVLGIRLESGFYEIRYQGSGWSQKGNGLALFDEKELKINTLIVWKYFNTTINETQVFQGSSYIELKTPQILGLVDEKGSLRPKTDGVYVVGVHKLKKTPN